VRHWFKGPRAIGTVDELERIEKELERISIYRQNKPVGM
jgi:hypothetical protein